MVWKPWGFSWKWFAWYGLVASKMTYKPFQSEDTYLLSIGPFWHTWKRLRNTGEGGN